MNVRIVNISMRNLDDIPSPCRSCIYWEFPDLFGKVSGAEAFFHKKNWFIKALSEFGVCGKILYIDADPCGYAQFAPYYMLPQTKAYGYYQGRDDALFLSCLFICKAEYRGIGLGSRLLKSIIFDLKARGFSRIETIARRGSTNNPSGPLEFYLKNGFEIKRKLNQNFVLTMLDLKG